MTQALKLLEDKKIFLSGGTGFVGKSLLNYLLTVGSALDITILSRTPQRFLSEYPQLGSRIRLVEGDITSYSSREKYDYFIHGATTVAGVNDPANAIRVIEETTLGTLNAIKNAAEMGVSRFLNISSGAVYGPQPEGMHTIPETYLGGPDVADLRSAYAEGKRVSEMIALAGGLDANFDVVNARCFAFVGEHLPLDSHFAIGNFILDGLNSRDIVIKGDGTSVRSYLYSNDLSRWLIGLLAYGESGESYNVGSSDAYSIREIAELVAKQFPNSKVVCLNQIEEKSNRYVPDVDKAASLGLINEVSLELAILETILRLQQR